MKDTPPPIQRILVPTDFSPTSATALTYAIAVARQFHSKITLLHVILPLPYPVDMVHRPDEPDHTIRPIRRELEVMAKKSVPAPLRAGSITQLGVPHQTVTEYARAEKIDLIVIGTHGRSDLAHIFLGSTAERVVRHASCPVLVVRRP